MRFHFFNVMSVILHNFAHCWFAIPLKYKNIFPGYKLYVENSGRSWNNYLWLIYLIYGMKVTLKFTHFTSIVLHVRSNSHCYPCGLFNEHCTLTLIGIIYFYFQLWVQISIEFIAIDVVLNIYVSFTTQTMIMVKCNKPMKHMWALRVESNGAASPYFSVCC